MISPVLFIDDMSRNNGVLVKDEAVQLALSLIATLKSARKVNKDFSINLSVPIGSYQVSDNFTLQLAFSGNEYREEWEFIRQLNSRSPISSEIETMISQQIEEIEYRTIPGGFESVALMYASLLDSAIFSHCIIPDWFNPMVDVTCTTLLDDAKLDITSEKVRNMSKPEHADFHKDWLEVLGFTENPSIDELWNEREKRYPGLRFLERTRKDLSDLAGASVPFNQAIISLESLSQDVQNWVSDAAWPSFSRKASPESATRRNYCNFYDESKGEERCFEWHVRFTGSFPGRVHFIVDEENHQIVVGYIGSKRLRA